MIVYRRTGDTLRYCGTVALAATPASGTIELPIRPAQGLTVAAKVVGTRQLNPLTVEHTCEVEIRSSRSAAAEVLVTAFLAGNWKIDDHTHDYRKLGEGGVEFSVPVPAGETVKLTYTVEVKSG